MEKVKLESKTNSSQAIPEFGEFDKAELDGLIARYGDITELDDAILTIDISTLPDCIFIDEDGTDSDNDEPWEQTSTSVGKNSVMAIFVHNHTGDELFFVYEQNQDN